MDAVNRIEVWILTRELNEYDQYGEYFVYAWPYKPGVKELQKVLGTLFTDYPKWLLKTGGGRQKKENEWFFLRSMETWNNLQEDPQLNLFNND